jgi:hypothetical protein
MANEALQQSESGALDFLSLSGNVLNLNVDGAARTITPGDDYSAVGDFEASFDQGGKVKLVGSARMFWKNESRINPTRWERLTWDVRALLITLGGTLFGGPLAYMFIAAVRKNSVITWLDF